MLVHRVRSTKLSSAIARTFLHHLHSLLGYTARESSFMADGNAYTFEEDPLIHAFKNQLTVIVGFCDLLLLELPDGNKMREDVVEIRKAAHVALGLAREMLPRGTHDADG